MLSYRLQFNGRKILSSVRFCHNERKELERPSNVQKSEQDVRLEFKRDPKAGVPMVQYWNERAAIKRAKRQSRFIYNIHNVVDVMRALQSIRSFPMSLTDLYNFFIKRSDRSELVKQKYLPRRVAVLRADLAAAHFLIQRGGSVKFFGKTEWVGFREEKKVLPITYIPGLFIECIKAEGTNLYYEGLPNLSNLKYLTDLSLKNLKTMNDWCLDWISKEYYLNLKHLDISGCVNVTHRGLSCFYRFECLETLNVEGIPDTPEMKLACLMLLEIMPHLDIKGIDLSIPKKIEVTEVTQISDSKKQVQELKS